MGCCGNHNKSFLEFSTDDIKDMNDLEQEVNYIVTNKNNIFKNDINSSLTISTLAKLEFGFYPEVELSPNSFFKINFFFRI